MILSRLIFLDLISLHHAIPKPPAESQGPYIRERSFSR
jgi:hypothetical protein